MSGEDSFSKAKLSRVRSREKSQQRRSQDSSPSEKKSESSEKSEQLQRRRSLANHSGKEKETSTPELTESLEGESETVGASSNTVTISVSFPDYKIGKTKCKLPVQGSVKDRCQDLQLMLSNLLKSVSVEERSVSFFLSHLSVVGFVILSPNTLAKSVTKQFVKRTQIN